MTINRFFTQTRPWLTCSSIRVVEVADMGNIINPGKWVEFIQPGFTVEIQGLLGSTLLKYRITDDATGDFVETGAFPQWRVVDVTVAI